MAYDMNENIAFNLELNLIPSRKYGMIFVLGSGPSCGVYHCDI